MKDSGILTFFRNVGIYFFYGLLKRLQQSFLFQKLRNLRSNLRTIHYFCAMGFVVGFIYSTCKGILNSIVSTGKTINESRMM
ncbi:hypothetical protein PDESU_02769 [Pontiella desulfatans]|uniref:Uncharacterized protein n=1 Tax=Pontiella desulfatans TaxID=2750659 RepID=A0A6C2U2K4_PONDE|nr:hypothetical protein PDESU_02769 [Pontiella desulfatans]